MHEMNGNWYPWGGTVNGNTPKQYRRAWRHIHGIFDQAGVTNVRWVWSPNAVDVPSTNRFERYFPGADYVDVMALDGYNWGDCRPEYGGWKSFDKVFRSAYNRIAKISRKSVWIAETASAPEGGNKARWVTNMFRVLPEYYPRVRAVVWFDTKKECDWRLTSSPDVLKAVVEALKKLG
jgi:beta-mannanase